MALSSYTRKFFSTLAQQGRSYASKVVTLFTSAPFGSFGNLSAIKRNSGHRADMSDNTIATRSGLELRSGRRAGVSNNPIAARIDFRRNTGQRAGMDNSALAVRIAFELTS